MRNVEKLSWEDFIKLYDKSVHKVIENNRRKPGVSGIATLKCEVLDSSRCGQITALIYGPECTYKTLDAMNKEQGGIYTTGLPSSAAFIYNYTEDMPNE
jgi:hypothetical protein